LTTHFLALLDAGKAPRLKKLWVISRRLNEPIDYGSYIAYVRHDVLTKTSTSLPVRRIGGLGKDIWLMRLAGGASGDVVAPLRGLSEASEEYAWQDATHGARLPSKVMKRSGLCVQPLVTPAEDFRRGSKVSCMLWRNEEMTGMQLLEPNRGDLMEEPAVSELTPEGWVREVGGGLLESHV